LRNRNILLVFVAATTIFFTLPAGSIIRDLLPGNIGSAWILFSGRMTTLILSAALALTLFLLFRLRGSHRMVNNSGNEIL